MMELELLKVLGAGGDVATVALVIFLWRYDRRLLKIELHLWPRGS